MDTISLDRKAGPPRVAQRLLRATIAMVALAALFVGVLFVRSWRASSNDDAPSAASAAAARVMPISAAIESTYGTRFVGVDLTAGGGMIQIRYQVLDSEKNEAIHSPELAPYVIDSHGAKYADPGMAGHGHSGKTQAAGSIAYILLANATGGVKPGSTVTIKIGDLELREVPVA